MLGQSATKSFAQTGGQMMKMVDHEKMVQQEKMRLAKVKEEREVGRQERKRKREDKSALKSEEKEAKKKPKIEL